ncbi:MAG TPA: zf-TFIIB domain-containing protein, partial [Polyangiaceae bacterium]
MMTQQHCPKCRSELLEAAKGTLASVEASERALTCPKCGGYFLPRHIVEHWQTHPFVEPEGEPVSMRPELDRKTGLCPLGHGIMVRAKVEADAVFYLERCGLCHGVWLDRGEWQRLAASLYLDHLDDLWDPHWQKQRRSEKLQRRLDQSLQDQLGEILYRDLESVVDRLHSHPSRAQALAWITQRLDPHGQMGTDLTNAARFAKRG